MIDKYPRIANDDSQLTQFKNDVIAGEYGGSSVELAGNSLAIPEQEGPQPIIMIDGVAYYHKQEFDLEELVHNFSSSFQLDPITGIEKENTPPMISVSITGPGPNYVSVSLRLNANELYYTLYGHQYSPVNFTSRAFTVVDTQEEVTDNTKICLPTCSAYYGFLSEDGKTFISYYNLKSEGATEYVDSIKQGNVVFSLVDKRLPEASSADESKVVKVNASGEYELGTTETGSHVYKHRISISSAGESATFYLINNVSTAYASASDLEQDNIYNELVPVTDIFGVGEPAGNSSARIEVRALKYSSAVHALRLYVGSITYNSDTSSTTAQYHVYEIYSVSDTVTEL